MTESEYRSSFQASEKTIEASLQRLERLTEPVPVSGTYLVPKPEQVQALLLRSAHFVVQVLSQDVRFRTEGNAITEQLGSVMDALGIHYDACKCGCKGQ